VLGVGHDALSIRFRPSFLATALGVRHLRVSTHEEALAFPVRGCFASSRLIVNQDI
jgi:hypothetical protein